MYRGDRGLGALFVVGALTFFSPLVLLWNHPVSVRGIPLLPAYLFGVWAALIALVPLALRRGR